MFPNEIKIIRSELSEKSIGGPLFDTDSFFRQRFRQESRDLLH